MCGSITGSLHSLEVTLESITFLQHTQPMQPMEDVRLLSDPAKVISRLSELDTTLTEELLLEANMRGYEARLEATPAHAPTAAGTFHWHAFVFALRLALKEQGWTTSDHLNCPSVISPDRTISILIITGDIDTGKEFGSPRNQADKGRVLSEAIDFNRTYELFENGAESGTQLWVLLYHAERDHKGVVKEIRTELSLPSRFENKKIAGWAERIILRPLSVGKQPDVVTTTPAEPIDFPVERRSAG